MFLVEYTVCVFQVEHDVKTLLDLIGAQHSTGGMREYAAPAQMADIQADTVSTFVRLRLTELHVSTREVAKRLGHSSNTMVGAVTARPPRKKVPLDDAENWANALRLEGEQRLRFFRLVMFESAPDYILAEFKRLRDSYNDLEAECEDLKNVVVREFIRHRGGETPAGGQPGLPSPPPPVTPS